jgi:hypothetical protein
MVDAGRQLASRSTGRRLTWVCHHRRFREQIALCYTYMLL